MKSADILNELRIMQQHSFDMLIFFVTGRCNAKCQHCFYWQNLDPFHFDLSLETVNKLSQSMPAFRTLLLSGGEPTLRSDLPLLVDIFRKNNHIQAASVPTNGLLPDRIAQIAQEMAALDPKMHVSFNVSIDGFAQVHDTIRGVPGSFDRAMETLTNLVQLGRQHPNLRALINTVICAENYEQIVPFAEHIRSMNLADGHFFEIVRGIPPQERIKSVPPQVLCEIYKKLVPIQSSYLVREAWRKRKGLLGMWRNITDVGNLVNRYRHQWAVHSSSKQWLFPCMAGEGIGVIDYDGKLRICELRDTSVDLADYEYNFAKAWHSCIIRHEAELAKTHICDCTHTCFLNVSLRQSFLARFLLGPWYYLLYKLGKA